MSRSEGKPQMGRSGRQPARVETPTGGAQQEERLVAKKKAAKKAAKKASKGGAKKSAKKASRKTSKKSAKKSSKKTSSGGMGGTPSM